MRSVIRYGQARRVRSKLVRPLPGSTMRRAGRRVASAVTMEPARSAETTFRLAGDVISRIAFIFELEDNAAYNRGNLRRIGSKLASVEAPGMRKSGNMLVFGEIATRHVGCTAQKQAE